MSILKEKQLNINERIRAKEVRLIGSDSQAIGIVSIEEARKYASDEGLDLIEIAPNAKPPVCKIMDYGKFRYEQGKKERESAKKQKRVEVKTIRLRPGTDEHDIDTKVKNIIKFLKQGNKVNISVIFKSREITHPEFAQQSLKKIADAVVADGCGKVEKNPTMDRRTLNMILAPAEN
ncbi:MAG: translation initiation factor IF-3 [Armatimonadetes bacterium]|nr:translation initiation factor IF-3 [Candidatus Hippobium faecium]